jgi:hypothetical protein
MRLGFGRRRERHPDEKEARRWVKTAIDRLRSSDESDLIAKVDSPEHLSFTSRTGRRLEGEVSVFWDRTGAPGSIAVIVDVCEPKPGVVTPIAQDSFIRSPEGSLTPPVSDPYESQVTTGVPGSAFHDATVEYLHFDPAGRTLQLDFELDRHWNPGAPERLCLRFEDVTDYEVTDLNDEGFNTVMALEVVVADDGRLDVELQSCYPSLGVEGRFRCGSIVEA